MSLPPPFPWFGGKSRAAHLIWPRFGPDIYNYVEPFAGSLAVLRARPGWNWQTGGWTGSQTRIETANDKDAYLSNFWRAVAADPDAVAYWADWPVNEADLHARHLWLVNQVDFREQMMSDPDYYDPKIAGWWVWGLCQWIGGGWCKVLEKKRPNLNNAGRGIHRLNRQRPHLGDAGRGVNRPHRPRPYLSSSQGILKVTQKIPHLGNAEQGIHRLNRQLPHLGNAGRGVNRQLPVLKQNQNIHSPNLGDIYDYMAALSARLRRVRVCCGGWDRILGPTPTYKLGMTAILLDPPYSAEAGRDDRLYAVDDLGIAHEVREWAIENDDNPLLRIALCGYEGEHEMPEDWECVAWMGNAGYSNQSNGNDNRHRERIWFSPHCLKVDRVEQLRFGLEEGSER